MTSSITYPSPLVPGPPPLRLEVPEDWAQVWAPDTLVAVRDAAGAADHFLANLVVRHHQRVAPFGPDQIAAELRAQAGQRPQGDLGPIRSRTVEEREWTGADLTFVDPQAGKVRQAHWFSVDGQDDVVGVLQVTGSCADSRWRTDGAAIDQIVDSIRVNP